MDTRFLALTMKLLLSEKIERCTGVNYGKIKSIQLNRIF